MVNNKGFIRIVELLIAVTLISGVLIFFYRQTASNSNNLSLSELSRDILADVSTREDLRQEIVSSRNVNSMTKTVAFINSSLPSYISFELRACDVSSACGQSNYIGDVFSAERIISASNSDFDPIKLRLFLWVP
jgi:hypothetical protein